MRGLEAERIRANVRSRLFQTSAAPVQVDRYLIEARVGEGGMGTVYRARDPQLMRDVALKLLRSAEGSSEKLLEEARTMARLEHPNVLGIHDMGTHQGQVFLVMKYVDGWNLAQWLAAQPRTPRELARVFAEAARGLSAAHRAGIVHRDFKPENVLIDRAGKVLVADFGLARETAPTEAAPFAVTKHTQVAGTPAYMAPELLTGERASARSDQFAFCVALHEALHGTRPFLGRGVDELRAAHRGAPAVGAGRVPGWLDRIAARGLSYDPASRHASMDEVVRLLERGPSRAPAWSAAAAGVLVLAGAGWLLRPSPAVEAPPAVQRPAPPQPPPDPPREQEPAPPRPAPPPPKQVPPKVGRTFIDVLDEANVAVRSAPRRDCYAGDLSARVSFNPDGSARKVELEPYRYATKRHEPPTADELGCLQRKFHALKVRPFDRREDESDTVSAELVEEQDGAGPYVAPSTAPANTTRLFEAVYDEALAAVKAAPARDCFGGDFTLKVSFTESGEPYEVKITGAPRSTPEQRDCLRRLFRSVRVRPFNRVPASADGFSIKLP